jgi:O-succinylbenzoic acid--CoA ligase
VEEARVIDFFSDETHLLVNPRLPADHHRALERLAGEAPSLRAHVWMATSGTTGALRLVALSKKAILSSAEAVNRHLDATARDVWLCILPTFHVGGLGIYARAALTGSRVVASAWDARQFIRTITAENVTLASVVPAQVRDLVALREHAPSPIRAIVVGGGALSLDTYAAAHALRWPVLPSYGMTETGSQIATAKGDSPELKILSHVEVRVDDGDRLAFRGPSLLTGYAFYDDDDRVVFADPKIDGWFVSEDRGAVDGDRLRVFGRSGEFVKIGGESVDLARLDAILDTLRRDVDAAIIAVDDDRLGSVIHLVTTSVESAGLVSAFNARVLPFERIRAVRRVSTIPRSPLGKLLRARLLAELR